MNIFVETKFPGRQYFHSEVKQTIKPVDYVKFLINDVYCDNKDEQKLRNLVLIALVSHFNVKPSCLLYKDMHFFDLKRDQSDAMLF